MGESELNFFSVTGGFVILFVGMSSKLYILRNIGREARRKKLTTLFVVQVGNSSNFHEKKKDPNLSPFHRIANIKPMGWLDRTWLVVFGNVQQKKKKAYDIG